MHVMPHSMPPPHVIMHLHLLVQQHVRLQQHLIEAPSCPSLRPEEGWKEGEKEDQQVQVQVQEEETETKEEDKEEFGACMRPPSHRRVTDSLFQSAATYVAT